MPVTGQATTEKQPKVSKTQSKEESMLLNQNDKMKTICIGIPVPASLTMPLCIESVTTKTTADKQPKVPTVTVEQSAKSMAMMYHTAILMIRDHAYRQPIDWKSYW